MRVLALSLATTLLLAAPAAADQQIRAGSGRVYANSAVTIAQGEKLTFRNLDQVVHDVTSTQILDFKPLFASPLVDPGSEAAVDGAQYLTTGEYPFACSLHPEMIGKLTVSSEGTPLPRPGATGATLKASAARLSSVRRARVLRVTVTGVAGSDAIVAADAPIAGKKVRLARSRVTLPSSGKRTISLKLTTKARSAIRRLSRLTVTFKATVLAPTGAQNVTVRRTYR